MPEIGGPENHVLSWGRPLACGRHPKDAIDYARVNRSVGAPVASLSYPSIRFTLHNRVNILGECSVKIFLHALIAFSFCQHISTYAAELPVPSDMGLEQPSPDVPAQCAAFFSPGGWGEGKWDDMRPGGLWIEKINPDCSAQVVYSYGSWPGRGDAPGYFRILDGKIVDSVLTIQFKVNQSPVTVTYRLHDETELRGFWQMGGRKAASSIRLKRLPSR